MLRPLPFVALLSSCALSHAAPTPLTDDSGIVLDVAVPASDVSAPLDGGCITPRGPTGWVPRETGECLSLHETGCAFCHERDGGFEIWPRGALPPAVGTPLMPGACGLCR